MPQGGRAGTCRGGRGRGRLSVQNMHGLANVLHVIIMAIDAACTVMIVSTEHYSRRDFGQQKSDGGGTHGMPTGDRWLS